MTALRVENLENHPVLQKSIGWLFESQRTFETVVSDISLTLDKHGFDPTFRLPLLLSKTKMVSVCGILTDRYNKDGNPNGISIFEIKSTNPVDLTIATSSHFLFGDKETFYAIRKLLVEDELTDDAKYHQLLESTIQAFIP
jgi:hypothetical protein